MKKITLTGDVMTSKEGMLYDYFNLEAIHPQKVRNLLQESNNEDIEVTLTTNGGSVFVGQEIYNSIKEYNGKTTLKIAGLVASIGTLISCAFDEVLISPAATFMIHNPTIGSVSGEKRDMEQAAQLLDTVEKTLLNAYVTKTGLDRGGLAELMMNQTFMTAQEAVDYGFADGFIEETEDSLQLVASFGEPNNNFIEVLQKLKKDKERDLAQARLRFFELEEKYVREN